MNDPLAPLLADGVIDEVVGRLKSGKEADVWLVRSAGQVVAAKVYKARHVRSFRNDSAYREGRQVRNTRTQRAMDKGSRFGQAASEDAWKTKESDALHRLHAAGVRVPQPVIFYEGVLVMELVLDAHGHPAPRLIDAHLHREQAAALYADLRHQAIAMLACDLIHGDLSPYNVLAGVAGPVVIDFPQVVDAAANSQAEKFFLRDLENVRHFCAALDPSLKAAESDGREIWRAYVRRELTPDFVPTGRAPEAQRPASRDGGGPRHPRHEGRAPHPGGQRPPQPHPGGQRPPPKQGRPAGPPPKGPQGRGQPPRGQASRGPNPGQPPRGPRPPAAVPEVVRVQRIVPASPAGAPRHGGGHGKPHGAHHGPHHGRHRNRGGR